VSFFCLAPPSLLSPPKFGSLISFHFARVRASNGLFGDATRPHRCVSVGTAATCTTKKVFFSFFFFLGWGRLLPCKCRFMSKAPRHPISWRGCKGSRCLGFNVVTKFSVTPQPPHPPRWSEAESEFLFSHKSNFSAAAFCVSQCAPPPFSFLTPKNKCFWRSVKFSGQGEWGGLPRRFHFPFLDCRDTAAS